MDWLFARLKSFGDQIAFHESDSKLTYQEFSELIRHLMRQFEKEGIRKGEAILLRGAGTSDLFAATLAAMGMGVIVAPLTSEAPLTPTQAEAIMRPQWSCVVADVTLKAQRIDFLTIERPELLNQLAGDEIGGLVLFSSGSSGSPKGILYDEERLLAKFRVQRESISVLSFLMLDHFGGINTVMAVLSSGGEVIVLPDRRVETVCRAIERHRVRVLPVTPTFIKILLASRTWKQYDMSSLKKITYGTEPMTETTLRRLEEAFPDVEFQQTYGLSELGVLRTKSKSDGSLWMKVGGEGFETKVKNGVLWIKSAYQMRGYLNAQAEIDDDGFFNTNDEVLVDGEYIRILGRISDVINVGGEKVYPAEIESFIERMPNIKAVAVYGEPHSILGEVIAAEIVLEQVEQLEHLRSRIRQDCRAQLGPRKTPTRVRIVSSLNVSGRQKTIRRVN